MDEKKKPAKEIPFSVRIHNAVKALQKEGPEYRRELLIRSGSLTKDGKPKVKPK